LRQALKCGNNVELRRVLNAATLLGVTGEDIEAATRRLRNEGPGSDYEHVGMHDSGSAMVATMQQLRSCDAVLTQPQMHTDGRAVATAGASVPTVGNMAGSAPGTFTETASQSNKPGPGGASMPTVGNMVGFAPRNLAETSSQLQEDYYGIVTQPQMHEGSSRGASSSHPGRQVETQSHMQAPGFMEGYGLPSGNRHMNGAMPGLMTSVFGSGPTPDAGLMTRVLGPGTSKDAGILDRILPSQGEVLDTIFGLGPSPDAGIMTRILGETPSMDAGFLERIFTSNLGNPSARPIPGVDKQPMPSEVGTQQQLHLPPSNEVGTQQQLHLPPSNEVCTQQQLHLPPSEEVGTQPKLHLPPSSTRSQQSASQHPYSVSTSDYEQPPTMLGLHPPAQTAPPSLRQDGSTARSTGARVRFGS